MTDSLRRRATVALGTGLAALAAAALPSSAVAAEDYRLKDGFESGGLTAWSSVTGNPEVQDRVAFRRHALHLERNGRADYLTRTFPEAKKVSISFRGRRGAGGFLSLVRFPTSDVLLIDDNGTLYAVVRGSWKRMNVGTVHTGSWYRAKLTLDASRDRLSLDVNGKRHTIRAGLEQESAVELGDWTQWDQAGPYWFDDVDVRTAGADQSVAAPAVSLSLPSGPLSGEVPVVAQLEDPSRVDSVRFSIDGQHVWTERIAPYVLNGDENTWDTTELADGEHTVRATVTDLNGGTSSAEVTVTIANASEVPTDPPATDPPATDPPATEPPATEPPATEPPATEPPATEPPATEPPATEPPVTEPPATDPPVSSNNFFAPASFWNQSLGSSPTIDPNSTAIVNDLVDQVDRYAPWMNYDQYSTAVYEVGPNQPTRHVTDSDDGFMTTGGTYHWNDVPLPDGALPANGTDKHLVIHQPSTDTMWEFWLFEWNNGTPRAAHGARIPNVSTNPGYLPSPYGATATGLPMVGGMMMIDEMQAGVIDHALALAIPEPRAGVVRWPAQRTDGWVNRTSAPAEGSRFQLDPSLNVDAMGLPPFTAMVAKAAQDYGLVVRDKAGSVALFGEDPRLHGGDPYASILGGQWPNNLLGQFPWQNLRLIAE